jgi:PTS system N-acetylglucosamine-specific IIC component
VALDACTTRLRLTVADQAAVDVEALKRLGARGVVRPSANALQVVVGTVADQLAGEMKSVLRTMPGLSAEPAPRAKPDLGAEPATAAALLSALGGRSNIRTIQTASTRLRINIADAAAVDQQAVLALGLRGVALATPNWLHVIVGPTAAATGSSLQELLAQPGV